MLSLFISVVSFHLDFRQGYLAELQQETLALVTFPCLKDLHMNIVCSAQDAFKCIFTPPLTHLRLELEVQQGIERSTFSCLLNQI